MISIYLEGNNGGDFIRIKQYKRQQKNNTCFVEVGSCCVRIFKHQIPVELLTNFFYKSFMEHDGDLKRITEATMGDFAKDFVQQCVSKVKVWEE